jgi:hypothetical protein
MPHLETAFLSPVQSVGNVLLYRLPSYPVFHHTEHDIQKYLILNKYKYYWDFAFGGGGEGGAGFFTTD